MARRERVAERRIGMVLRDKWRLEVLLGVGGMGAVYEARHRNGSRAAIKVLHEELATYAMERERFRREAYIANRVEHPAVVRVLDDDESDGVPFLVMELVDGQPLDALCTRPLGSPELLDVADQVLDALVVAHARGVVHRDIKPQNLLLDRDHRVRILDFGIAGVADEPAPQEEGSIVGTLEYMAPEQLRGDPGCARSDLYALGTTLFGLGAGVPMHLGSCTVERVRRVLCEEPRPLASVAPHLDPELAAVVDRATRPCREERWPNAEQMRREVRRIRARMPSASWDLGRSERSEVPTTRMRTPAPAPVAPEVLAAAARLHARRAESQPLPVHKGPSIVLAALAALAMLFGLLLLLGGIHA